LLEALNIFFFNLGLRTLYTLCERRMKFHFFIQCSTKWGETLSLYLGNGQEDDHKEFAMAYFDEQFWHIELDLLKEQLPFSYFYAKKDASGIMEYDGEKQHEIKVFPASKSIVTVIDEWIGAGHPAHVFYTQPFSVFQQMEKHLAPGTRQPKGFTHCFRAKAPLLGEHETLCLVGSTPKLKKWDTANPLLMKPENGWYTLRLKLPVTEDRILYKYGIYNSRKKQFIAYEAGENRFIPYKRSAKETFFIHDAVARTPIASWKGTGVAIPVFSLRSKEGFGTGEFADIPLFCSWAKKCGLKLLQILPVNDTSADWNNKDSYPYSAISAFALHPLYLRLQEVGELPAEHKLQRRFSRKQRQLNRQPGVEYESVMRFKMAYLRELFTLQQQDTFLSEDFQNFFAQHQDWLVPYAVYSYLRDKYNTPDFSQWKKLGVYHQAKVAKLADPANKAYPEIAFWYFVQYHLHLQLSAAVNAAHEQGIVLKGDIPIGIYRHSCDAWVNPGLYHMDMQAGAPPDDFAVKGQNWGFPTYNWEMMQQNGFSWWKRRFEQMSHYFDAFRIDHILGFFRIWSIPQHASEGIMGRFVPALPVTQNEMLQKGIVFNHTRFCTPYITETILWELFGDNSETIKKQFLQPGGEGGYVLQPFADTQRKVEAWFATNGRQPQLEAGLNTLVANVILFEGNTPGEYHFRIGMEKTFSFSQLNWHTQQQLKELYNDYFYRRQNDFWKTEALKKLPALKHTTNMLVCGEDLGMVPDCVPGVMNDLGIIGLEVQRMPKRSDTRFTHLGEVPYLSVVTPSTHDMSTVREWWEEDKAATNFFYNHVLGHFGEAPQYCEPWIAKKIIGQHLESNAMWSIFQLQDLLAMDDTLRREHPSEERINIPANPDHFWNYRMHLKLEDLKNKKIFNHQLKEMIVATGR
jgi:4-alpha-glucanotransferase